MDCSLAPPLNSTKAPVGCTHLARIACWWEGRSAYSAGRSIITHLHRCRPSPILTFHIQRYVVTCIKGGMSLSLLNSSGKRCQLMKLCGFQALLKRVCGRVLKLMDSQRGFERGQVFVGFQPTEALGCFHYAGSGPTQHHGDVSPSLYVATDAAHRPHHVFD